jgi:hypothetical protein
MMNISLVFSKYAAPSHDADPVAAWVPAANAPLLTTASAIPFQMRLVQAKIRRK